MICCDVCEDWFHGKCVNITKAMGQQMEADGIEWTCPNCLKKKQEKQVCTYFWAFAWLILSGAAYRCGSVF